MREPNAFWLGLELLVGGLIVVATIFLQKGGVREWMLFVAVGLCFIVFAFTGSPTGATVALVAQRAAPFAGVALWSAIAVHFAFTTRSKINLIYDDMGNLHESQQKEIDTKLDRAASALLSTELIMAISPPKEVADLRDQLRTEMAAANKAISASLANVREGLLKLINDSDSKRSGNDAEQYSAMLKVLDVTAARSSEIASSVKELEGKIASQEQSISKLWQVIGRRPVP